jgi:DNA-binding IclR family transcriptional regulator
MTLEERTTGRGRDGATLARVRAVSRAVAILRAFAPGRMHLTLGEIAAAANLDAGTARRLLVTLRDEGLVAQAADTGRYHLTMQMLRFAGAVPEGRALSDLAAEDLRALADDTGLTVLLSVLREGEAICLSRHHGDSPVQVRWWPVGEAMPLNCGAAPRLLLAHMQEDAREAVLAAPLTALTRHSVTNPVALREMLAQVRCQGWSLAVDDVVEGLSAVAAPVLGSDGRPVAAVSLGGLTPTILAAPDMPRAEVLERLMAACASVSRRLDQSNFNV